MVSTGPIFRGKVTAVDPKNPDRAKTAVSELVLAKAHESGYAAADPEAAYLFWDSRAFLHAWGSLETLVMLHHGYAATLALPKELREHRVDGHGLYENGRDAELARRVIDQSDRIVERFKGAGMSPMPKKELIRAMAQYEVLFPELEGQFEPGDFEAPIPKLYQLRPEPARAEALFARVLEACTDTFPELAIDPSMEETEIADALRRFLLRYREADRLFRDGGRDHVHCDWSALLVSGLILVKGFDAFPIWLTHADFMNGMEADQQMLCGMATALGLKPSRVQELLESCHDGEDMTSFRRKLSSTSNSAEEMDLLFAFLNRIPRHQLDRLTAIEINEIEHSVAAVRIGSQDYLLDIDAQQFGATCDRLTFVPADEAFMHGLALSTGSVQSLREALTFEKRILALAAIYREEQLILREYLEIL